MFQMAFNCKLNDDNTMIKYLKFLTIAIALIAGSALSALAKGNKVMRLPINDSDFRNRLGQHIFEVEAAKLLGSASKASDSKASGGYVVCLSKTGEGVELSNMPAANKLAIRYASVTVGTISVAVNNQPARKINIHSTGALTGSFLY